MNREFSFVTHNGLRLLVYLPWWNEGILHGMTLRDFSFGGDDSDAAIAEFSKATGVTALANPKQTHSDLFYDLRSPETVATMLAARGSLVRFAECDALLCSQGGAQGEGRVAFAVATADCVPVIVRGRTSWAVIHAGWRGLANGILARVLQSIEAPLEAAIFAAAGGAAYEVGPEVVEAIGSSAAVVEARGDKILLDTAETAKNQLMSFLAPERVATSGVCTITDQRFHSYRRDGQLAGRSLTFVIP
jgi:copper oxidase (laccase) domain-containing protein